uniref:Calcium-regulated actin-bundling protein C-terminal domain-containing protein n=1 Tax=Norrisiella sphaerica TaxID=552664 RepID=A0A7S2QSY2_9EUKA|mmetsp:Transcript_2374/g.3426  ORF Transcript_2374/g.3426 Transcript_2374/m.3426 type:complete len:358 (+) Transcript_2374:324-1397(+)|eukprot:CAMPEP_0184483532 /NCGR_PEP_ID=MMETSP0113_2-20130426/5194_1 /TAXON_ID=91329 /ORGANISM="Norrisiella sphaerica, Strain BC52" /LENGTH=357 /DNA_ID=CAMNT_0026864007 /DNA_START=306 /DNA_END=1379 /DNA_ORIENTATION=+
MADTKAAAERKKIFEDLQKGGANDLNKVTPKVSDGLNRSKMLGNIKKGAKLNNVQAPSTELSRAQKMQFRKERAEAKGESFVEKLDDEGLKFFNHIAEQKFSDQAIAFLNAYWGEVGSQAEFIYTVAWDKFKYADMHARGISYVHKYKEGTKLEFDIGLYFYEQLCKFLGESKNQEWKDEKYEISQPKLVTAIVRKKELRDKVDVNFDGHVSMIEYLLYQYRHFANPADFVTRSMNHDEHPEIRKARLALEEVNKRIQAYEAEKSRLEAEQKKKGVKGLRATNMLAQLNSSPLWEKLQAALITAEAAVRIATKKYGGKVFKGEGGRAMGSSEGSIWWLNRDLAEKKKKYGRVPKGKK